MAQTAPLPLAPAPTPPSFDQDALSILDKIRGLAARARSAARMDAFTTCALMQGNPGAAASSYGEALLRLLRQGFGRSPVIYPQGAAEISADEAWILRAVTSAAAGDEGSLHFLTRRHLSPATQRPIVFLIRNLSSRLDSF